MGNCVPAKVALYSLPLCLGGALLIIDNGSIERIAASATLGRLPSIFSIPLQDPNLSEYRTAQQYADLLRFGLRAVGGTVILAFGTWLIYRWVADRIVSNTKMNTVLAWLVQVAFLVAVAAACIDVLSLRGYEGKWYTLESAIQFTADPPYVHRILFPSLARLLLTVYPTLSVKHAYGIVEFGVILAAVATIYHLNGRFVAKATALLACALLIPMILFSTSYYTFYDYGIILFFSLGLTSLYDKRTILYFVTIAVATLNHENILLLILISGALHKPFTPSGRYDFKFVSLQLAVHAAVRIGLLMAMPVDRVSALGNIWINLHFISMAAHNPKALLDTAMLLFWFSIGLIGIRSAPPSLRIASLILPMLLGITFLVGQINEARQFVAFIPIAIALLSCEIESLSKTASLQRAVETQTSELTPHWRERPLTVSES